MQFKLYKNTVHNIEPNRTESLTLFNKENKIMYCVFSSLNCILNVFVPPVQMSLHTIIIEAWKQNMYNYVINSFAGMKSNECLELEHLIHQAFELSTAFLKDRKLFGQNGRLLIVLFFKMFTNH